MSELLRLGKCAGSLFGVNIADPLTIAITW